ncbi:hypothetical protein GOODEAATRI_032112 [Goodea atripinnis]|uniref:DDE Tnp4 domain-containing protein n=1 Tax=Goodea atripinnis TaxID=208336 RepID=A0ABV0MYV7_9TELE
MLFVWRIWDFPLLLGLSVSVCLPTISTSSNLSAALDGNVSEFIALQDLAAIFFNYKETHSLILMNVCDAHYRITMLDVGAYGHQSDGGIFQESVFWTKIVDWNSGHSTTRRPARDHCHQSTCLCGGCCLSTP